MALPTQDTPTVVIDRNAASRRWKAKKKLEDPEDYKATISERNRKWREANREEHARRNAEWYKQNPDKVKNTVLKTKFGITKEQYDQILNQQDGVCAICKKVCKTGRNLAADHCHKTGTIRGLLCTKCNTAIGALDECEERFISAMNYIKAHKS